MPRGAYLCRSNTRTVGSLISNELFHRNYQVARKHERELIAKLFVPRILSEFAETVKFF